MKVFFKKLSEKAQVPVKASGYETDFCYDCCAVSEEEIAPNVWKYGFGFALQPVNEYDGHNIRAFNVRARSSVWKTGMVLSNAQGIVDESYTGEISVVFYHVMPDMPRYKVGDKLCQICLERTEALDFVEVTELRKTVRGDRGYGHTGK